MIETSRAPRRRWLYAPYIALAVLALLWSAGWFYAAHRADGVITAWLAREAAEGRTYDCGQRTAGGFPFRIEVRCREPSATLKMADGPVVVKARDLLAVAQVYQPDLVIVEVTGPMTVSAPSGGGDFTAEWTRFHLSARGKPRAPERVSIVVEGPKLDRAGATPTPVARARQLEFHLRKSAQPEAGPGAFDLALVAAEAVFPELTTLGNRSLNAEALAVLTGPADLSATPLHQRLRAWQAAGGRLELRSARVQQENALAVAQGTLALTPQGRVDGTVNMKMAGLDRVVNALFGGTGTSRSTAGLLAGLALLGGTQLEGRRAIAVPLRFDDGRVYFGPIPIYDLPALY